jgi:hypothetical protein
VRRQQQANDLQSRLAAQGREAVCGAGNKKRVHFGFGHTSMVAEIWKNVKPFPFCFFSDTLSLLYASYLMAAFRSWKRFLFRF